jgi:hypothetical protein
MASKLHSEVGVGEKGVVMYQGGGTQNGGRKRNLVLKRCLTIRDCGVPNYRMSLGDYTAYVEETRESSNAREKVGG